MISLLLQVYMSPRMSVNNKDIILILGYNYNLRDKITENLLNTNMVCLLANDVINI